MLLKIFVLKVMIVILSGEAEGKKNNRMPAPLHPGFRVKATDLRQLSKRLKIERGSEWEKSGLLEGDIVESIFRNVLTGQKTKWESPIPVCINESDFDEEKIEQIKLAMHDITTKSCLTFRKCQSNDTSFIMVRGNSTGCWSSVGRHEGGQILHLQRDGCMRHGIIVHEFLHALGFYHQHSAPERDDYIDIHWENIETGKESNFLRRTHNEVSSFNITYDYESVMHYGKRAFSKNKESTIVPKDPEARIGQREKMSNKDILKLNYLYDCKSSNITHEKSEEYESLLDDDFESVDFFYL